MKRNPNKVAKKGKGLMFWLPVIAVTGGLGYLAYKLLYKPPPKEELKKEISPEIKPERIPGSTKASVIFSISSEKDTISRIATIPESDQNKIISKIKWVSSQVASQIKRLQPYLFSDEIRTLYRNLYDLDSRLTLFQTTAFGRGDPEKAKKLSSETIDLIINNIKTIE